ncbi:MAG: cytochrome b [Paracoccaceae bacterium]
MKTANGYSAAQIALHWVVAVLVAANYFLGDGMERALKQRIEQGAEPGTRAGLHVWIGVAVLVLVLVRIAVRFRSGAPGVPDGTPGAMRTAARLGHLALYALMIGVPLGGAAAWFGGFRSVGEVHALGGNLLMLVAGLHALAALVHQFVLKDGLLMPMLRPG